VKSGEPDFTTVAQIQEVRRFYFLHKMEGRTTGLQVMNDELPPKDEAINGIPWLPRIIQKAKIKLRGEMNPDLMYGCGGDRNFLKTHDIHLAEFLEFVRDHWDDEAAVVAWVEGRSSQSAES